MKALLMILAATCLALMFVILNTGDNPLLLELLVFYSDIVPVVLIGSVVLFLYGIFKVFVTGRLDKTKKVRGYWLICFAITLVTLILISWVIINNFTYAIVS